MASVVVQLNSMNVMFVEVSVLIGFTMNVIVVVHILIFVEFVVVQVYKLVGLIAGQLLMLQQDIILLIW